MSFHTSPTIAALIGLPPQIALLGTLAFIFFLLRRDFRQRPNVTGALWLPFLWVLLIGSRPIASWLTMMGFTSVVGSAEEGNPVDATVYFTLIVAGIYILNQRQINVSELLRRNVWFVVFLVYCLISIIWSDFAFSAFKRWIKMLGHPVMALVLFTEPDFKEALITVIKRAACIFFPLSVLLIKYYPAIGRSFDEFSGMPSNNGINISKSGLGGGTMLVSFFLFWYLLQIWRRRHDRAWRNEVWVTGGLLLIAGWLLRKAHSATSDVCLLVAIAVLLLVGRHWVNKRLIGIYIVVVGMCLLIAQLTFGIYQQVVDLSGHASTIAGRKELWRALLAMDTNPVFGVGFDSFWMGERLRTLWEMHWWKPTQAHNGYLEIYLNLGLIGVMLLLALIISTFRNIRWELLRDFEWGRVRLSLLIAILLHNWTEASFRGLALSWFIFYLIAMEYPKGGYDPEAESLETLPEGEEVELTHFEHTT
jgi:exopolysaccharide production protein ExoQ